MRKINERYTRETYDENGLLKTYRLEYPENYNFGYDIVDDIAVNDPQRVAMYWDSVHAGPRKFTFTRWPTLTATATSGRRRPGSKPTTRTAISTWRSSATRFS